MYKARSINNISLILLSLHFKGVKGYTHIDVKRRLGPCFINIIVERSTFFKNSTCRYTSQSGFQSSHERPAQIMFIHQPGIDLELLILVPLFFTIKIVKIKCRARHFATEGYPSVFKQFFPHIDLLWQYYVENPSISEFIFIGKRRQYRDQYGWIYHSSQSNGHLGPFIRF